MARQKEINPLIQNTEKGSNAEETVSSRSRQDPDGGLSQDAEIMENMASSVTALESKTDTTKNTILNTIMEIRNQIGDERAISEALRSDLEDTRRVLAEKEKEIAALEAELGAQKEKAGLIEGLKDEIAFITSEVQTAHDTIEKQKSEMAQKDNAFKELQTKQIAVEEERSKLLREIKNEMENSLRVQRELAVYSKEKDDAIREKNQLAAKYAQLQTEITRLREESKALEEIQQALTDTRRSTRK
jgi:chromosome segregation ATPase